MNVLVFTLLVAGAYAQQQDTWWIGGTCGVTKYPDSGEGCMPGDSCSRIVGGTIARDNEFPWQASLRDEEGTHYCGGSVINDFWIVTSAYCVYNKDLSVFSAVLGATSLGFVSPSERTYAIDKGIPHELYTWCGSQCNDVHFNVALIKTATMIEISENITPICAPFIDDSYTGELGRITGFGAIGEGGGLTDQLRYASVAVTSQSFCASVYGSDADAYSFCAEDTGGTQKDTCHYDEGGPVAIERNGQFLLVGLAIDRFFICGDEDWPGFYVNLSPTLYADWIAEKLAKN